MNNGLAAEILEEHNAWRRGGDGEPTDVRLLGLAIDQAVEVLKRTPALVSKPRVKRKPKKERLRR